MKNGDQKMEEPKLDHSDVQHRFAISSHLRDAENEIDQLHGKWLLCQKKNGELTKQLAEAMVEIGDLKKKIEPIGNGEIGK